MISFIAKKNEKYSFEQDAINTMREREREMNLLYHAGRLYSDSKKISDTNWTEI